MLLYTSHIPHPLLCTCMYLYHVRQSAWHAHVWTVSQAPLLCQLCIVFIPMHTIPLYNTVYDKKEVSFSTYLRYFPLAQSAAKIQIKYSQSIADYAEHLTC